MSRPAHADVVEATVSAEDTMAPQVVPVKAYEAPEALIVVAPMPCVQPEDVHIELREDTLRFWAHLRSAAPRDYLIDEWDFGGFEREIDIPDGYGAGIESTLANGQLVIRLLKGAYTGDLKAKPQPV